MKIFLVEDDTAIVFGLRKFMELNGWEVIASLTYRDALLNFSHDIDLCIVDIELPDGNGLDFCRHIKSNSNIPVIFLTAKSHERTVIEAFDLGADDYITKPFRLDELKRRILAVTRRTHTGIYHHQNITLNIHTATAHLDHEPINLSTQEYRLLLYLLKHQNTLLTRQELNHVIWQTDDYITDNALSVIIRRLKEKCDNKLRIETVHGKGYIVIS